MNSRIVRVRFPLVVIAALLVGASTQSAATMSLADRPLYLTSVPPAIMVMMDNSGSMKEPLYKSGFNPSVSYHGIFDATKNYVYDNAIPVNTAAYAPVTVDSTATGAFVESTCAPSPGDATCWSGSFLNWLTTRRADSARKVLVGGKLESELPFAYGADAAGNALQYKVVGNNEFADDDLTKSYGSSSNYSPIPDGQSIVVYSPAEANGGAQLASYDPYAKIVGGGGGGLIYNDAGSPIGEFGKVETDENWATVSFQGSYTSPVVVATAPSFRGGDPGVVRIRNVSAGAGTFEVSFQEWKYRDGGHLDESISYVVMEGASGGLHTLPGGKRVKVGTVSTNKELDNGNCGSTGKTQYESPGFAAGFSAAPVVIASVMTFNGSDTVNARTWDVTSSGFKVALQEEEAQSTHATETVGYLAIETGTATDTTNLWGMEAGTIGSVTDSTSTITFTLSGGGAEPSFIAATQTRNENDALAIRTNSLSSSTAQIHIEEEKSCDSETSHSAEQVGYVAFWGGGARNVALALPNKPVGLLQKFDGRARLGLSFYRYDLNKSDIYNGVTTDGGTLQFKIPKNPYVKKPTDTGLPSAERGYRELFGYVGTDVDDLSDALQHYPLIWGTTPIAENLWEVIRYFEQSAPYYPAMATGFPDFIRADENGDGTPENPDLDPFYYPKYGSTLECAVPSVVIFTDGYPYRDAAIDSSLVDYDGDGAGDDVSNMTTTSNVGTDNLDDVAHWGFCDKSKGAACPDSNGDGVIDSDDKGSRDLRSDIPGDQSLRVYTVGFADGSIRPILQDTADNAGGQAYAAQDGDALETALSAAFSDALASSSAAPVALNSGTLSGSSKIYQARFDSSNWSGSLLAYTVNLDGSIASTPDWDAASLIPAYGSRKIFTHDGTSGVAFAWTNLTASQKTALSNDSTLLDFLRGDRSNESASGFRIRGGVLGDIVHSAPQFVGPPGLRYPDDWNGSTAEPEDSAPYSAFVSDPLNAGRASVVYSGANDGMLHAFDASSGAELFAYVPSMLMDGLADLASQSYAHRYYVDGPPTILDAFYDGAWHTVLAGGLQAGGQGVYALDVTQPGAFGASNVLWEFSDADDADMGYSFAQPSIVRMHDGRTPSSTKWAAVFGNGYDNTHADGVTGNGHAVLYIVDIKDGSVIRKIDTGVGDLANPNGLSTATPVDVDGDYIVDYIYAGDLRGNLWKFDVTSSNRMSWGVAFSGNPLFTACAGGDCSVDPRQPITSRPTVRMHPTGRGSMVYFGTGKYFENGDNSVVGQTTQSFYAVWDKGSAHQAFDRDHLLQQNIIAEVTGGSGSNYRVVSDNALTWHTDNTSLPSGSPPTTHLGWYMDLFNTEGGATANLGERMVSRPVLRGDRIIFSTLLPSADTCGTGGTSWRMELAVTNGGRVPYTPFDVDGDGVFDTGDFVDVDLDGDGKTEKVSVSGDQSDVGISNGSSSIVAGDGLEYRIESGSLEGEISSERVNAPSNAGRRSWRQLR